MNIFSTSAMAALLAGNIVSANPAVIEQNAQPPVQMEKSEEVKETTDFLKINGTIKEVEYTGNKWTATIQNEGEVIANITIDKQSLLLNSSNGESIKPSELKQGLEIEAYYDKNKPMIMIYPPQITPEILIVNDEKKPGFVKVGKFDHKFLSLDKQLKLNIGKNTILENQAGTELKVKDLLDKELIIFYSATTRGIPPQTIPAKIVAYDNLIEKKMKIEEMIKEDFIIKEGVKMIPLRKIAEELGFTVDEGSEMKDVFVTKGNMSFSIKYGEKTYGYNRSIGKFEQAPIYREGKAYVSEEFLAKLLEN